ncbi:MAG: class I SAM-dependent methyltransferase [Planctomycetota bacterium]|jgi:SAM-dependent methyltransferase
MNNDEQQSINSQTNTNTVTLDRGVPQTAPAARVVVRPERSVESVRNYWNAHTLGRQYVKDTSLAFGSEEYFEHIRPWMSPFKFPWIMDRIERESKLLQGKRILEIGCGMGFVSAEFIKRGVKVTATDLTPAAIEASRLHFKVKGLEPEELRTANALDLDFPDNSFDAVWSNGVLHATGDTALAVREVRRVLKPGGRAIIGHFYRKPSWMWTLHRFGRENIEFKEEDPPVNDFLRESEVRALFQGFDIEEAARDHHRALPVARTGLKAALYHWGFRPVYNLLPAPIAKLLAYKYSITAVKK